VAGGRSGSSPPIWTASLGAGPRHKIRTQVSAVERPGVVRTDDHSTVAGSHAQR
jgi:hypothetical protein